MGSTIDKNVEFKGQVKESPLSEDLFDDRPYVNDTIRWVRTKTAYQQELNIKTKEDFHVYGRIQFSIEPRCTFEEIPFAIIYENGEYLITPPKC